MFDYKNLHKNIKKIQNFNRPEEKSDLKKKSAEINAPGSGSLKLNLKNTGNINSMNINFK